MPKQPSKIVEKTGGLNNILKLRDLKNLGLAEQKRLGKDLIRPRDLIRKGWTEISTELQGGRITDR